MYSRHVLVHCSMVTLDLLNTVRDEHRRMDRTGRVGDSEINNIECYHGDHNQILHNIIIVPALCTLPSQIVASTYVEYTNTE